METCILIPREFSIVLKAFASPPSPEHSPRKKGPAAGSPASAAADQLRSRHWDFNRKRPRLNTLPKKRARYDSEVEDLSMKKQRSDLTELSAATTTIPSPTSSPEPSEGLRVEGRESPREEEGVQPPRHRVLRPVPVYSPLEMGATVWANVPLLPGQVFYPDHGDIRLEHLEIYSRLPRYDVRYKFGCIDEVQEVDNREVRHCNWVRFVQSTRCIDDVNIVAIRIRDHTVYQVVKLIQPNTELRVFFDETNLESRIASPIPSLRTHEIPSPRTTVIHGSIHGSSHKSAFNPISISPPTVQLPRASCPLSPASQGSLRSLLTPPSDREDDSKSTFSDITVGSADSRQHEKDVQSQQTKLTRTPNGNNQSTVLEIVPQVSPVIPSVSPEPHSPGGPTHSPSTPEVTPLSSSMETPSPVVPGHRSPPSSAETIGYGIPQSSSQDVKPDFLHASPTLPVGDNELTPARVTVKRNRERTWLPCEVCGKKFDRPSLLRRHMRTHTGEKPHACDVCGKAFSTSSSLNTHRRIHSGEKPHQCQICGKRFTASSNLYYHKMTHNKEKPHKCGLCSKSFPTPGDLKSHMYVHNGSWPFKCDVCNRGFSKQTNLKNHMLLHSGDKPHGCPLCGKRFALQCNLKTHLKTHEADPQNECYKCGRCFLTSARQVVHGYCRDCLSTAHVKSPVPHRPTSYTVESLATPSDRKPSPPGGRSNGSRSALDFSTPPHGGAGGRHPTLRIPGTSPMTPSGIPMRGFPHFGEPKPGSLPTPTRGFPVPGAPTMHPGMIPYGAMFPWPKLVQQPY